MPDDAMEIWKREVATADAAEGGLRPDRSATSRSDPAEATGVTRGARVALPLRYLVPALLGGGFALLILLGGELSDISGPVIGLPALLGGMAALVANRRGPEAIGWAVVAWLAAFGTTAVVAPLLIFLEFLDCWASWLSDC